MRFGFSRGNETIRQIVRQKSSPYDITRPTDRGNARFGESDASTTTIEDVSLYLYDPGESALDTEFGDRLSGDLNGLALPNVDVNKDDRLTYDGTEYEVADVPAMVKDGVIKAFPLEKVTN